MNKPAFPRPISGESYNYNPEDSREVADQQDGMSLLEYYAGQALSGITARVACDSAALPEISKTAFNVAESMVKEAEKRQ